jgi:hypothetical protein
MVTLDLDAARAARLEAKSAGPAVTFGGRTFTLPPEVSYEVVAQVGALERGDLDALGAMMRALLGDCYGDFMAGHPSIEDMEALVEGVLTGYGLGETSAASSPPSRRTTKRRKPQ